MRFIPVSTCREADRVAVAVDSEQVVVIRGRPRRVGPLKDDRAVEVFSEPAAANFVVVSTSGEGVDGPSYG